MKDFCIKNDKFSGPLDLLLSLIEKNNMNVNDFSLSKITNEFVEYINKNSVSSFGLASFLSVAATLILIKSKSLLPTLELTSEEKEEIFFLKDRLACYKLFKEKKDSFKDMIKGHSTLCGREFVFLKKIKYSDPKNLNGVRLKESILNIFNTYVKETKKLPVKKIKLRVSLKERIFEYSKLFKNSEKLVFNDLVLKQGKLDTVVSFMAVLHLAKQGKVDIVQENLNIIQVINKN